MAMTVKVMTRRELLTTAAAVALAGKANAQSGIERNTSPQDIVLWYDKPAARWADALPIGNGRLGAMVFGGGADGASSKEFLQINEDTLWSGRPQDGNNREASRYIPAIRKAVMEQGDYQEADRLCQNMQGLFAEAYQPLANIAIEFQHAGELRQYRRELNLDTACARTTCAVDDTEFESIAFASAPDQVLVYRATASGSGKLNCEIALSSPLQKTVSPLGQQQLLLTGKAPSHVAGAGHPDSEDPVKHSDVPGEGMYFTAIMRVKDRRRYGCSTKEIGFECEGRMRSPYCSRRVPDTAVTRIFQIRRLDDIVRKTQRTMDAAVVKTFDELRTRQAEDHQRLFRRVSLRLGPKADVAGKSTDKRLSKVGDALDPSLLALYFQYGRYLLISSSRPGTQPANLQGIWNELGHAALEFELDGEHQPADELLAGGGVQFVGMRRAAVRPHRGIERYRSTRGAADLQSAGLGIASQHRFMAGSESRGPRCRSADLGELEHERPMAVPTSIRALPLYGRRGVPSLAGLSVDARRGRVLPCMVVRRWQGALDNVSV